MESKNYTSMNSTFDLDMRAFFGIPNFDVWSLGYLGKNQLSSPLITRFFNCESASTFSSRSAQTLNRAYCCCFVRFLDTILAHIFLIPNSSFSVKRTVSWFMSTSSTVVLTVHLCSDRKVLLPLLRCHLSVLLMVVRCTAQLQQGFCLQKTFYASLVLLTLHNLQWPTEVPKVLW